MIDYWTLNSVITFFFFHNQVGYIPLDPLFVFWVYIIGLLCIVDTLGNEPRGAPWWSGVPNDKTNGMNICKENYILIKYLLIRMK